MGSGHEATWNKNRQNQSCEALVILILHNVWCNYQVSCVNHDRIIHNHNQELMNCHVNRSLQKLVWSEWGMSTRYQIWNWRNWWWFMACIKIPSITNRIQEILCFLNCSLSRRSHTQRSPVTRSIKSLFSCSLAKLSYGLDLSAMQICKWTCQSGIGWECWKWMYSYILGGTWSLMTGKSLGSSLSDCM